MPPSPGSLSGPTHYPACILHSEVSHALKPALHFNFTATKDVSIYVGSHTHSGLYVCLGTRVGSFSNPSMRVSHTPKSAREHPTPRHLCLPSACVPHLPDAKGGGCGENLVSDKPLLPPPPIPSSQNWALAGWTDGQIDDQQPVFSKVPLTNGFHLPH